MEKQLTFKLERPVEDLIPGKIAFNNEQLLRDAKEIAERYSKAVYTEDMIPQAKEDRAKLNNAIKAINDVRIKIGKVYNEPYTEFKSKIDEVIAALQQPVALIGEQINTFEAERKEKKRTYLARCYSEAAAGLEEFVPFERIFNDKWLNASVSTRTAVAEMDSKIENIHSALSAIEALKDEDVATLKAFFFRTLDLAATLAENERLKETRRRIEQQAKERTEGYAKAAQNAPHAVTEAKEDVVEAIYDVTIEFKGMTVAQANLLMAFIKENGLTYVRLK